MKFGVRECANIVFRAKQPVRIGTASFQIGQPVLYIDTATTSSMEQSTTTVYAQGGRGNARLLAWEGEKTLTFSFTDALLSPIGFAILSGAGLFKRGDGINSEKETTNQQDLVHFHMTSNASLSFDSDGDAIVDLRDALAEFGGQAQLCVDDAPIYIMEIEDDGSLTGRIFTGTFSNVTSSSTGSDASGILHISDVKLDGATTTKDAAVMVDYYIDLPGKHVYEADITPDTFGGNYYVEADTLFRDQYTGKDMPANLTFPNVRLQSNFTMTFAGTGDPSTFDFTMDAFPGYTYFDKKKKVLAVLQVVDSIGLGGSTTSNDVDPVMYHDDVDQHAAEARKDSQLTEDELGAKVATFEFIDGTDEYTVTFNNIKDSLDMMTILTILDSDGNDLSDEVSPVFKIESGNAGGYISLDADGYIVALKNTTGSSSVKVSATVYSKIGGESAGSTGTATSKSVNLLVKVDDTSAKG